MPQRYLVLLLLCLLLPIHILFQQVQILLVLLLRLLLLEGGTCEGAEELGVVNEGAGALSYLPHVHKLLSFSICIQVIEGKVLIVFALVLLLNHFLKPVFLRVSQCSVLVRLLEVE